MPEFSVLSQRQKPHARRPVAYTRDSRKPSELIHTSLHKTQSPFVICQRVDDHHPSAYEKRNRPPQYTYEILHFDTHALALGLLDYPKSDRIGRGKEAIVAGSSCLVFRTRWDR